jgi:ornithine cyclodeaminase
MHIISDNDVARLLDYQSVVTTLERAFSDLSTGAAAIHPRQRTDCGSAKLSTMGALWANMHVAGAKIYPTVDGQFSFAVLLFDLVKNAPVALVEGSELTRFRTAAITALVVPKLMRRRPSKLALFGAGLQGRSQVEALTEQLSFEQICVVDPVPQLQWAARLAERTGARVDHVSPEDAVRQSDVIVTATRSPRPVFDGEWLAPGTVVAAIGTSGPKARELDDVTMSRASRIVVEWKPQSLREAGEIVQWDGHQDLDRFVDLPELFAGDQSWHGRDEDLTVFKSVGVGLSDVAAAWLAYSRFEARQ